MANTTATTEQLVEECQGLVRFLARQIHAKLSSRLDIEDLIGYGQLGVVQAAREFDPDRGIKFSTYAYYRIRGAIYDGVNKLQWFRAARDPEVKTGPLVDAVLESAGEDGAAAANAGQVTSEANWLGHVATSLAVIYLASTNESGTATDVADDSVPAPWEGVVQQETRTRLHHAIDSLAPDSAALIRTVYLQDQTLQEAADQLGISKSWASRLHSRALEQMARYLKNSGV